MGSYGLNDLFVHQVDKGWIVLVSFVNVTVLVGVLLL